MPLNSGDDLDPLLLAGEDFSFAAGGESPDLTCLRGDKDFFTSGEYLDLPLGGDLGCSFTDGEEPDLLRRGGDLDFFNSKESIFPFSTGEVDFFFISETPDAVRLGGETDCSLSSGGEPDLLCLSCGDLGFSFTATDLPVRLRCNGDVDVRSGEVACLGGDKELSFVDD